MIVLLAKTCELLIRKILHCLIYSLISQLLLALILYILFSDSEEPVAVLATICFLFLFANTLFFYAATQTMLSDDVHNRIDLTRLFYWRRAHTDFFLFVTFGILILSVLCVYFIDAVDYLFSRVTHFQQQQLALSAGELAPSVATGGYTVLIFGSRALAAFLLLIMIYTWLYICRTGIRLPAYVEGYYLRSDEAGQLQRGSGMEMMSISFLIIIAVTTFAELLVLEIPLEQKIWLSPLIWAFSYFIITTTHIAMWILLYKRNVKQVGYHMNRLLH